MAQIGTALDAGSGTTIGNYIVESITTGDKDVHSEDIRDEDGVLATRIVKQTMNKISLSLIAKSGATPATDFPVGAMAVATGYTSYYVDSCSISKSENAARVSVSLTNIGIS